jgi:hypothetical protein
VTLALKALVAAALPGAMVTGFDADAEKPARIPAGGIVVGGRGDPGEPDVDLSPLSYNYTHRFALEIAAEDGAGGAPLDTMLLALGAAIVADRHLGGLCQWLDVEAAEYLDVTDAAVPSVNWALVPVIAEYSTTRRSTSSPTPATWWFRSTAAPSVIGWR